MPTLAQLKQQYDALQALSDRDFSAGRMYDKGRQAQMEALLNQSNQQAASENAAAQSKTQNDAAAKAQAAHDELFGNARGRVDSLTNDPIDKLVLDQLKARGTGQTNPYDATTINALVAGNAGQSAEAERQAMAQLSKSGLNPGDPAYQSAVQEIMGRRQASNQQANLNINQQANVANYGAQGTALGQLTNANAQHNQGVTAAQQYLGGLLQADQISGPQTSLGGGGGGGFNVGSLAPSGGYNYSTAAPQAPAPQRQATAPASAPAAVQPARAQPMGYYSNSTTASNRLQGPADPSIGTGYGQLSGQPSTRINTYGSSYNPYGYDPNLPVY